MGDALPPLSPPAAHFALSLVASSPLTMISEAGTWEEGNAFENHGAASVEERLPKIRLHATLQT